MKELFTIAILSAALVTATINTSNDHVLCEQYIKDHYPDLIVQQVSDASIYQIEHRKGTVLVEVFTSTSAGDHGYTADGYYIAYNKEVPKGKKVTSYVIYNPDNNYTDDVVAVIDNGEIR